ncbi:reverse transcriptase family protein [Emticicia sp. BO119]|uniref:reverse transcriptase family protein n=1 Tax=Emticicia sp. BO119 TaxID=2757768 RepID=UPI0015F073D3|nr:reverse transcriptase family protein [Emticicia sp. BO119]MBA4848979.1 RNA-directed DNA polymerase [Emticicia sp. BO119]
MARLLGIEHRTLDYLAERPQYNEFDVPKKNGGFRHIEDPDNELKNVLRLFNDYLQAVYYFRKSDAAYGFVRVPDNDTAPRNILSNAEKHRNRPWMLNVDFLDFFHQIKQIEIYELFVCPPFNFGEELAVLLSKLTTYKGRLPMGSPTSPVLSNFATLLLDQDLLGFATKKDLVYSRFADDLTFSANSPLSVEHLTGIRQICAFYGLKLNENKINFFLPHQTKIVTGLIVTNRVDIPHTYLEDLRKEIDKLRTVLEINYRTGRQASEWVQRFHQQIEGAIEFIRQIETSKSPDYQQIRQYYAESQQMAENYQPTSWLDFGYHKFI